MIPYLLRVRKPDGKDFPAFSVKSFLTKTVDYGKKFRLVILNHILRRNI
jgi:hypothetical protein